MFHVRYAWMIMAVLVWVLYPVCGRGEEPVDQYQQRVSDLREEMLKASRDIDEGVDQILGMILPLADSKDTGNKVTQLKQSAIQSLRNVIDIYVTERQKLEGDLARAAAPLTKTQMAGQVEAIDGKIDERIDDILRISESLARNREFEKYDYAYDYEDDAFEQRVNEDYRQNQRVQRRVVDTRGDLAESLKASIASLDNRIDRYQRALAYQTTPENADALSQLIDETRKRMEERRQQLASLGDLGGEEARRTIGKRDLKLISDMVNQYKMEIKASLDHLRRLKGEYDNALIRMNNARRTAR